MLTVDITHPNTNAHEIQHYPYANSSTFPLLLDEYGPGYWWHFVEMMRNSPVESKLVDVLPDVFYAKKHLKWRESDLFNEIKQNLNPPQPSEEEYLIFRSVLHR